MKINTLTDRLAQNEQLIEAVQITEAKRASHVAFVLRHLIESLKDNSSSHTERSRPESPTPLLASSIPFERSSASFSATVIGAKVNLRAGPSLSHLPLMSVSRGTNLLVNGKDGEWY